MMPIIGSNSRKHFLVLSMCC